MEPLQVYGAFSKVQEQDDGTLYVEGVASTEDRDTQGEVVTAAAMRKALPDYLRFPAIREMHAMWAAGRAVGAVVDDQGVTHVAARIVDKEACEKIRQKVYNGFSIGGRVDANGRSKADPTVIESLTLTEISLVDRPANPAAVFQVVKIDQGATSPDAKGVQMPEKIKAAHTEPDGDEGKPMPAGGGDETPPGAMDQNKAEAVCPHCGEPLEKSCAKCGAKLAAEVVTLQKTLRASADTHAATLKQAEAKAREAAEQVAALTAQVVKVQAERDAVEGRTKRLRGERDRAEGEFAKARAERDTWEAAAIKAQAQAKTHEERIAKESSGRLDAETRAAKAEATVVSLTDVLGKTARERDAALSDAGRVRAERDAEAGRAARLTSERNEMEGTIGKLTSEREHTQAALTKAEATIAALKTERDEQVKTAEEFKSQRDKLQAEKAASPKGALKAVPVSKGADVESSPEGKEPDEEADAVALIRKSHQKPLPFGDTKRGAQ